MAKRLKRSKWFYAPVIFVSLIFCPQMSFAVNQDLAERLDLSAEVFKALMESEDQRIPRNLLKHCEAVMIFPKTYNLAWGIGGQFGRGVALRHDKVKRDWGAPAFYTIESLTFGPQVGGQAVDIVLLVMNEYGLKSLLKSQTTLGGDAGIALGPVGRNATASTDLGLKAEIYSYSRAKGLYIGLSLKGAMVSPDSTAITDYYGTGFTAQDILMNGRGAHQKYSKKLLAQLRKYTPDRLSFIGLIVFWAVILTAGIFLAGRWFIRRNLN